MPSFATTTIPDLTGKLIDGRYKLTEVIGSGSFGVVYRAIDESVEAEDDDDPARAVAVKVVNKSNERLHDASHLRMEIALHKRASLLPRVVTLRAAHDDGEFAYLVMDLCRGGSLGQHVEAHGPYTDEARLRATFLAIVDAVRDLHRVGIYHRDIKPGNILLGGEDGTEVFLGDFGLATRSEGYSYFAGTRPYMPPELLYPKYNSRPSPAQSDVWALGIVLLNMVSGRVPWPSACTFEAAFFDFVRDPDHLLNDDYFPVSPGLNRVIRRMLRQNPATRMGLEEVRAAVEELDVLLREVEVPVTAREVDIGEEGAVVGGGADGVVDERWYTGKEEQSEVREAVRRKPTEGSDEIQEVLRSTFLRELDIAAERQARMAEMQEQHEQACAAAVRGGGGGSTLDFGPNTAARAGRKCGGGSKGSSSAKSSTMAETPGDSEVVVEKKDIGERMREIVARVKFKFRSR